MLSPVFKYFKALVVAQLALGRSKCLDTRQWFALPQDFIGGVVALQRWGDNHLTVVRAPVFRVSVRIFASLGKSSGILEMSLHSQFEVLVGGSNVEFPGVVACAFVDNASVPAHVVVVAPSSSSPLAIAIEVIEPK